MSIAGSTQDGIIVQARGGIQTTLRLIQNTIVRAGGAGIRIQGIWDGSVSRIEGNVIADCAQGLMGEEQPPQSGTVDNLVYPSTAPSDLPATGTLTDAPGFFAHSNDGNDHNDELRLSCASRGIDRLGVDLLTQDADGSPGDLGAYGGPWALPRVGLQGLLSLDGRGAWGAGLVVDFPSAPLQVRVAELHRVTFDRAACGRADCEDLRLVEDCNDGLVEVARTLAMLHVDEGELRFAAQTNDSEGSYCDYTAYLGNPDAGAPDYCDRILVDEDFDDGDWTDAPEWVPTGSAWQVAADGKQGDALQGPLVEPSSGSSMLTTYDRIEIGGGRGLYSRFSTRCSAGAAYGLGHRVVEASQPTGASGGGVRLTLEEDASQGLSSLVGAEGDVLIASVVSCPAGWGDWEVDWVEQAVSVRLDGAPLVSGTDPVDHFSVEGTFIPHGSASSWTDDIQVATFPIGFYGDSSTMPVSTMPGDPFLPDLDGDGVPLGEDCDDFDPNVHPDAVEFACDGVDSNCDGEPGSQDQDGDGEPAASCLGGTDCDDSDPHVFPGSPELCDGLDNDCDGAPSFDGEPEYDLDGDGWFDCEGGDCDDTDGTVHPEAQDLCDGVDSDCADGHPGVPEDEADADGDGFRACDQNECDDNDGGRNGGRTEVCDGVDNDCDAATWTEGEQQDEDGDGAPLCLDCDDQNSGVHPGREEVCDAVDNDCDGDTVEEWGDRDEDGIPDCVDFDQPPGLPISCSAGGAGGWLLLPLLLLRRRRGWLVLAILAVAAPAIAAPADEVAAKAAEVFEARCGRSAGRDVADATLMHVEVGQALADVDAAWKETSEPYLLYWRAVLAQCLVEGELARSDLETFWLAMRDDPVFATLVQDAERRLRRMGWTPPDDGPRSARTHDRAGRPWQRLTVEVGGGAGILNSIEWVRPGVGLDVMGRLHGPLTLVGVARFSLSTDVDTHDGSSHDGDQATLLPAVGVGVGLRWASPITPVFAAWFQVAPNVAAPDVPPVLPGGRLLVGVELGLGPKAPVAFRPAVEVGFLGPYPSLFGGLSVVVRLPDATTPSPVAAR